MALLGSYSFNENTEVSSRKSWILFKEMQDSPESQFDCSLELLEAARRGEINLERAAEAAAQGRLKEVFSLRAYDNKVNRNNNRVDYKRYQKNLHICDVDEDGKIDSYGVPETAVVEQVKPIDDYEKFDNEDEFKCAFRDFLDFRSMCLIEYKCDCVHCLRQALRGIAPAIIGLKKLIETDYRIGECIQILLSSGKELEPLLDAELGV